MRVAPVIALPIIASLIAAALPGAPEAATLRTPLELSAAWSGVSRPGRMTELRLRLSAAAAGTVRLHIESGGAVIESAVVVRRQEPEDVSIPVPASEMLTVRAQFPDGTPVVRNLTLRLAEEPLIAVATSSFRRAAESGTAPGEAAWVEVNSAELPRQRQAYEAVDAIVIDAGAVARLDADQLQVLIGYVGRCGALVAIALPEATSTLLRTEAGCGGRALMLVPDRATADAAVLSTLAAAPASPAGRATLRPLLPEAAGPWPFVVAGLISYFAGAALLLAFVRRPPVLATYALLGTLTVLLGQHLVNPMPRLSIWAESESQDHRGRYTALAETTGAGRVTGTQVLPELLEGAEPCTAADDAVSIDDARWNWDPARSRFVSVTFEQRLFATASVCWHGGFPLARAASTQRLAAGGILVTNHGPVNWPAGVAVQDGRRYLLPAVPPSTTRVLFTSALAPESAAADLAAMSSDRDHGVLLWPLELPALGVEHISARAFLAVRAAKDVEVR